ncbi:hypothetical protein DPMN_103738 [Dreissena polymorpha]|uniref:Uncharacterized protein n=1 Tax=Dreissena polymorpha TaxID=45954 RepID=A0A9D4K126_DREPO|nr:hypothetical protein DPMN_103738 [Dreissena polymorpha]
MMSILGGGILFWPCPPVFPSIRHFCVGSHTLEVLWWISSKLVTPGAVTWMQILSRWAKMGAARETRLELTSLEGAG